jgi:hypothetical protein
MRSLVIVAVLVPTIAHAQPGVVDPEPPVMMPQAIPVRVDTVSEDVAVGLSLGGTVASWGLLLAGGKMGNDTMATIGAIGTMFAPSLGHWYSHSVFTRGLGIRALGLGVGLIGLSMALSNFSSDSEDNTNNDGTIGALLLIGAGLYVAGTVDDIAMAPTAARRHNTRFANVTIVPQITQRGGGFSLVGRF